MSRSNHSAPYPDATPLKSLAASELVLVTTLRLWVAAACGPNERNSGIRWYDGLAAAGVSEEGAMAFHEGRWRQHFRQLHQYFGIGPLDALASPVIGQHPLRDPGQKCARLPYGNRLITGQQSEEGIVGQIRRPLRASQLLAQPGLQPPVVMVVQAMDGLLQGGFDFRHSVHYLSIRRALSSN